METYKITLITPKELINTTISIFYDEERSYVKLILLFNGKEIPSQGYDYLWVDAFANLQKQLPKDVILKCCMTCRHGNMCPYGNKLGEIFCTSDLLITSKEDMCNLFDNYEKHRMDERIKNVADSCDEYSPQSNDYYTYNDYLYHLDK